MCLGAYLREVFALALEVRFLLLVGEPFLEISDTGAPLQPEMLAAEKEALRVAAPYSPPEGCLREGVVIW